MTNELSGPAGSPTTTARTGDTDRSLVASRPAIGTLAEVVDEEGGSNRNRSLSAPASRGTGPVDPAYDFVDNERA